MFVQNTAVTVHILVSYYRRGDDVDFGVEQANKPGNTGYMPCSINFLENWETGTEKNC